HSLVQARGSFGPCALCIGNFDGVHCGHVSIFHEAVRVAVRNGWKAAVLTFDPHPTKVVAPERAPAILSSVAQRCRWMGEAGIEEVLILPFDRSVASLSPEEFVRDVVVGALNARAVLVGDNFRFGHKHAGDPKLLRELGDKYGFEADGLPAVKLRGVMISSSEIRKCLLAGNVARAARMLGRFFAAEGNVVAGHGVGSKQTVPTLNLKPDGQMTPARGVYVTITRDPDTGRRWESVTNIGYRPRFGGDDELSIEPFLLSGLDGAPPQRIQVEFRHRLRDEQKFPDAASLKAQIFRDVARARAWHRRYASIAKSG